MRGQIANLAAVSFTGSRRLRPRGVALLIALGSWIVAGGCAGWGAPGLLPPAPAMDPARIGKDVSWLADDARDGRSAGSAGLAAAGAYLAAGFREAGLAPGGDDGTYLQRFDMPASIHVAEAVLQLGDEAFERGADFDAFASSSDGDLQAEVVFAGYGISAPEQGYDDYAGLDVEGRIVLVLDDQPGGEDSPLAGPHGASLLLRSHKIATARSHGAAAILLAPSAPDEGGAPGEPSRDTANPAVRPSGIVALWVSRACADRLAAAGGADLAEWQRSIDASIEPASENLGASARIAVRIERESAQVANVIGVVEGTDPELRREAVVIGAHYDHLGRGPFGSLTPERSGEVHNGADDNASGTAGLLELARAFGSAPAPRRTLVIVAFAGEEVGLLGSREYVERPVVSLDDTAAMINLDMVGRLRGGSLSVFGHDTSPDFERLVKRAASGVPVVVSLAQGGFAPSDQTTFYARNVPVLFFFTGTHDEYHTPDDDAPLVNREGEALVLEVVYRAARVLLDADDRPEVIAAAPRSMSNVGSGSGYGPYFGTIPEFVAAVEPGVTLQGVRPGSPAEKAGLLPGDRIVEFAGSEVTNLEEYAAMLFSSRPGREIEIVVVREGERITMRATLGRRR